MGRRRKLLVRCGRPEQLRDDFFTSGRTSQLFAAPDVTMENLGVWNVGDLIVNSLQSHLLSETCFKSPSAGERGDKEERRWR